MSPYTIQKSLVHPWKRTRLDGGTLYSREVECGSTWVTRVSWTTHVPSLYVGLTTCVKNNFGTFTTRCNAIWCTPNSCPRHKLNRNESMSYFIMPGLNDMTTSKRNEYRRSDPPHNIRDLDRSRFDISLTYWPFHTRYWGTSGMSMLIDYRRQNVTTESYRDGRRIACTHKHRYHVYSRNNMHPCLCKSNYSALNCNQLYDIQSVSRDYAPGGVCSGVTYLMCRELKINVTSMTLETIVGFAQKACDSEAYLLWSPQRLC